MIAAIAGKRGDIYNNGIALSGEALLGFQQEVGKDRIFRGVELLPDNLHPDIRRRYFFPPQPMRLIVAYAPDGPVKEIFRDAGRVAFKGFERQGGIRIWEAGERDRRRSAHLAAPCAGVAGRALARWDQATRTLTTAQEALLTSLLFFAGAARGAGT